MDILVNEAFRQSFWIGVLAVTLSSQFAFMVWAIRYYMKRLAETQKEKDDYRDKYEAQQREDLKLLIQVQEALKEHNTSQVPALLTEIKLKIDQLLQSMIKG